MDASWPEEELEEELEEERDVRICDMESELASRKVESAMLEDARG